jgi:hypothetical protein
MTTHLLVEDTEEDIRTMRRLRNFVAGFMLLAFAMAVAVGVLAP